MNIVSIVFWIVVFGAVWFAIYIAAGYFAYKTMKETVDDYFVAGRNIGTILNTLAWMGAMFSAFMFLGLFGMSYKDGMGAFVQGYIIALMTLFYCIAGIPAWALGKEYGYISPIDLFVDRYESQALRYWLAFVTLCICIPYMSVQIAGAGYLLTGVTQGAIPHWVGVTTATILMGLYMIPGGYKSVTWVDAIQGALLIFVLWFMLLFLYLKAGGDMAQIIEQVKASPPLDKMLTLPGVEQTFTHGLYAFLAILAISWGFFPQLYPRFYAAKNPKAIILMSLIVGAAAPLIFWHAAVGGLITRILVPGLKGLEVDKVLPIALGKYGSPWIIGLFSAGCLAAILSTATSFVMAVAAIVVKDLYQAERRKKSQMEIIRIGRYGVFSFLVLALLIALKPPSLIVYIVWTTFALGIQLAPLMFSTYYWPRANKYGALAGSVIGVVIVFLHLFLAVYVDPAYINLSLWGMHPGLVAFIPNLIVFVLVTYLTPPPSREIQEKFHGFLKRRFRFAKETVAFKRVPPSPSL